MNIIIASFALLTSVTTLPDATVKVVPTQTNTFSKDEIVKIISTEHQANQKLESFIVSLPGINLETKTTTASVRKNNGSVINNQRSVGDE